MVDIVISTLNNKSKKNYSIRHTIRSILQQKDVKISSINIGENGSTDDTAASLEEDFSNKINIIDTSHLRENIAQSRNTAASVGQSEKIFFIDDDVVPENLHTISKCLKIASEVDFACGAKRLWTPLNWHQIIRQDDPMRKVISTLKNVAFEPVSINRIIGKNIIDNRTFIANFGVISRDVFEKLEGFDNTYSGFGYHDTDLMHRLCLRRYEYDLFCEHGIVAYHLAHKVDKSKCYEINRQTFIERQRSDGRMFNVNHFFHIYENDGYSLYSDFPD